MARILTLIFVLLSFILQANNEIPRVPSTMEFAGMKLKITERARREIQDHVDKLRASEKYFKIKLDRVNLYFPIIEKIFKEANLPDDFKYLSIQESALIADAVSSANAVGFWQFKSFTGREVGLRIDNQVDERLNIVSASRGAAKYMKTNNFYYNNWIYALMAYNTGRGGARKYVDESNYGQKKMTIDKKTHWYVKTFLAHKIAFENEIGGPHSEGLKLLEYEKGGGKSMAKIAKEFDMDVAQLKEYNVWLKKGSIPTDKVYTVVIPVKGKTPKKTKDLIAKKPDTKSGTKTSDTPSKADKKYPTALKEWLEYAKEVYIEINGLSAILARADDTPATLATKGSIPVYRFMKFNELGESEKIKPGRLYYLKRKRGKAKIAFHITQPGETLWDISQLYGVKKKKISKFNRLDPNHELKPGHLLWLSKKRPANLGIQYINIEDESVLPPLEYKELPIELDSVKSITMPVSDLAAHRVALDSIDYHIHTVEKGETLYRISKIYQMDIDDIIAINNMDPYNMTIEIDQQIKVIKPEIAVIEVPTDSAGVSKENPEIIVETESKEETKENLETKSSTVKKIVHIVKQGETLYSISRMYEASVEDILSWNNLTLEDGLDIDQELIIEKDSKGESSSNIESVTKDEDKLEVSTTNNTHTVGPGDTLYSIARKYNITVQDLIRLNDKANAHIKIGEVLKVKN